MNNQDDMSRNFPVQFRAAGPADAAGERSSASFRAQLLGAGGARRGLRGGLAVLQAARGAYLEAEWSGQADRRGCAGLLARRRV